MVYLLGAGYPNSVSKEIGGRGTWEQGKRPVPPLMVSSLRAVDVRLDSVGVVDLSGNDVGERCFNCGVQLRKNNRDREHVIPKMFFPKEQRGQLGEDLITVPSCKRCNQNAKKDQELLLLFVSLQSHQHPIARRQWEAEILPRLRQPRNRRLAQYLRSIITDDVEIRSPEGLILGRAPIAVGDPNRLFPVYQQIARGLYYYHFKSYTIAGFDVPIFYEIPREVRELAVSNGVRDPWKGIFTYAYGRGDDPYRFMFYMRFYNARPIIAMSESKAGWPHSVRGSHPGGAQGSDAGGRAILV